MTKELFLDCLKDNTKAYGKYGLIIADPAHSEIAEAGIFKILVRHLENYYDLNEEEKKLLHDKSGSFRVFFKRMHNKGQTKGEKRLDRKKTDKKANDFSFTKDVFKDGAGGGKSHFEKL